MSLDHFVYLATSGQRLESYCYSLGYRFSCYITLGLLGLQGPPEDEHLVIPVECRFDESTKRGMLAGTEDVFKKYNIKGIGRSGTIIYK